MVGVVTVALLFLAAAGSAVPAKPAATLESRALTAAATQAPPARSTGFRRFHRAPPDFTLPPPQPERFDAVRGVYLTANSMRNARYPDTLENLKDVARPAVVFDAKGGGVFFDSSSPLAREWGTVQPMYDLPQVLAEMKAAGIYTIARFVAIKDQTLIELHPEFSVRHPQTGERIVNNWIDPAHPDAIRYNMEIVCELARAGIDEINFDYIRYSTATPLALSVISPEDKAAAVETFLKAARATIDRCGSRTRLGISTYAILGWNRDINLPTLGQDVARFAPLVDVISPMAYPATFAENAYYSPGKDPGPRSYFLVYRTLQGYREWIGEEQAKKLRPWIQAYGFDAADIEAEIRAVYDAGLCGYQLWSAGNKYAESYKAMKAFTDIPERCV